MFVKNEVIACLLRSGKNLFKQTMSRQQLHALCCLLLSTICYTQLEYINRDQNTNDNIIECDQSTVNSSYPEGCDISCTTKGSCGTDSLQSNQQRTTILCPRQSNSQCIIHCETGNSCTNTDIAYNVSSLSSPPSGLSIVLFCDGQESCANITINAPSLANVTVYCKDGGGRECNSLTIDGSNSDFGTDRYICFCCYIF